METTLVEPLARLKGLYSQGLYLQAYETGQTLLGPLREWPSPDGRLMAGRLANNLGARRLGRWLFLRAFREHPDYPEVRYFYVWSRLERRGPLAAWEFLKHAGEMPDAPHKIRADWFALHSRVLSMLRDFEAAEHWLQRALLIAEDRPWIWVEHSHLLEREDRYEESLAAARKALQLQPWYRPAVQSAAHELTLLSRQDEARQLLIEASGHLESGDILVQLAMLEAEQDLHRQAADSLERAIHHFPLLEKDYRRWLTARRCDAEYRLGNDEKAVELAREAGGPFFDQLAEKLAAKTEGRRVALPVGFVRQHHVTCAPATLSAISRYWSMPADHLDVAQRICYDGTPAHSERSWGEENGWVAREFTVTWESATAMIDRGLPFTLTTVMPGSSHLQAVIGYDSRLRTLVVRDPTEPYATEMLVDSLLEICRSSGPRGMTMVPHSEAARLEGLELPDAALYDTYYAFHRALESHDRPRARQLVDELLATDPEHRLSLGAQLVLARYDNDVTASLAVVERLIDKYPEDLNLQLLKLWALRELARRDERLAMLEKLYAEGRRDYLVCQNLARELRDDAREYPRVIRLLNTAIRSNPTDADSFHTLAGVYWDQLQWNRAAELFRLAACLADKDESLAKAYFMATRHLKRVDDALRFLRERFQRYGSRSSSPARTLCWAYEELNRLNEAFDLAEEAMQLRPDDGSLILYAADLAARHNRTAKADELLARAQHRSHAQAWQRTAANLALYRGDHATALTHWRAVADAEPLAADAHRTVASLMADGGDRSAALEYLRGVTERFPHNYLLQQLLIEWLRASEPGEAEAAVRRLLEIHPVDAWGHRELALTLSRLGRCEEALTEANLATELDPSNPSSFAIRGLVHTHLGKVAEAKEDFRRAIRLSVDNEVSIDGLMTACDNEAQRREELEFIRAELERQVIFGDGLSSFRQHARNTLSADELLAVLNEACQVRPDLWNAWSALIWQLIDTNRLDEALRTAEEACERFPLLPRIWLDLAGVQRAREDRQGEIAALERALEINPTWGPPARRLAEIHDAAGDLQQSRDVLEQAVSRDPGDAINLGCLSDVLWRLGDKPAAIERLERALRLDPGYDWGWETLPVWLAEFDRAGEVVELAREIVAARPGEARSWLILSRVLPGEATDEALSALDRAIALNPCLAEAHDLKAERLANAGRFQEALLACHPAAWPDRPPVLLRARAADIEQRRGNTAEAIDQMKSVVAEEPDYPWAWYRLAAWYHDDNSITDDYLHAAEQLERLSPQSPPTWAHVGAARLRMGDREGAKAGFRRAVELAPDYTFSGLWLIDLHLEDGQLDEAEEAIAQLKQHDSEAFVVARQVDLASRRRQREQALDFLRELCRTKLDEPWPFTSSLEALRLAGYRRAARSVLQEALHWPEANPQVGQAWLSLCGIWSRPLGVLDRIENKSEAWLRAAISQLESLVEKKAARAAVRFIHRHADRLREDPRSWTTAAWAMIQLNHYGEAAEWTEGWQQREQLTQHPLFSRAVALWSLDRWEEAMDVSRAALDLPADQTLPLHQLWLAAGELMSGQARAAAERVAQVDRAQLSAYYQALAALLTPAAEQLIPQAERCASTVVSCTTYGVSDQSQEMSYLQLRSALRKALKPYWNTFINDKLLVRLYHRILFRVAQDRHWRLPALWHGRSR